MDILDLNLVASYSMASDHIHKMAEVLKSSLTNVKRDSYKDVYNWTFISGLELWSRVICAHYEQVEFRTLLSPITQLITGVVNFLPCLKYFAIQIRLIRIMSRLAQITYNFIPNSQVLLQIIQFFCFHKCPNSKWYLINLNETFKVSKAVINKKCFVNAIINQVLGGIEDHLCHYSYDVAFPELCHISSLQLLNFIKCISNGRIRKLVKHFIRVIKHTIDFIHYLRDLPDLSPMDLKRANIFSANEKIRRLSPMEENFRYECYKRKT